MSARLKPDRRNVGLDRAALDRDAKTGAADIGAAAGHQLALFSQRVDHRRIEHGDIESFAGLDLLLQVGVDLEVHGDLVAGRLLKLRAQLAHRRLGAVAAQHLELSRVRGQDGKQKRKGGNQGLHGLTTCFLEPSLAGLF